MEKSEASTQETPEGGCRAFLDVHSSLFQLGCWLPPSHWPQKLVSLRAIVGSACRVGQKSDMSYLEVF